PDTQSTAAWDTLMNVNAKGVFLGMKHAIPALQRAGGGAIVNISSISGFVGQDRIHMGYNASKGAVRLMTKSAAVQYAKDGIRVNSVHPGIMPPMRTSTVSADPDWRAKTLRAVPMKREGRVEEVAYAVLFLASDEASYIRSEEHTSELQSLRHLVCRLLLEKKKHSFDQRLVHCQPRHTTR